LTKGDESMALTRRALLEHIGRAGGVGAAYMAMETLGLAIPTPAGAENFRLPADSGHGKSVVILGAGIAGLVSAYELQRAGYRVTVLEARDRIGGRSWTIRAGHRIVQTGRPDQVATFDPGLYFNAGPARLPSTHRVILGYARRFGVQLQPFVNSNRNAGWDFGGKVHQERLRISRESIEALHPGRSKLLSKGVSIGWGLVPYSGGVGALWPDAATPGASRGERYAELLKPEGPIVFAGEHLSYQGLWQEGAARSAHEALKLVAAMAKDRHALETAE
jgi:monoamine oxidase